jgi:hypothetical protein
MSANSSISTSDPRPTTRTGLLFVAAAIAVAALILASAAALNWEIDPFDKLGRNLIGIYNSSERDAKPQMLVRYPHDGLILGSSRMTYIDPTTIQGYTLFNAAFSAATPEEILDFLRVYAVDEKLVIVGLDFLMFNNSYLPLVPNSFKPVAPRQKQAALHLTYTEMRELGDYLLSWDVTWNSVKAAAEDVFDINPPFLLPGGNRDPRKNFAESSRLTKPDEAASIEYWRMHTLHDFQYSQARLAALRKIKELLQDRHIPLIVIITPDNESFIALIHELGLYPLYLKFRADIREIFPDALDFSESRWSSNNYRFKNDTGHFVPQAGTEMIEQALAKHNKRESPKAQ